MPLKHPLLPSSCWQTSTVPTPCPTPGTIALEKKVGSSSAMFLILHKIDASSQICQLSNLSTVKSVDCQICQLSNLSNVMSCQIRAWICASSLFSKLKWSAVGPRPIIDPRIKHTWFPKRRSAIGVIWNNPEKVLLLLKACLRR
jgi:hypothetical protein